MSEMLWVGIGVALVVGVMVALVVVAKRRGHDLGAVSETWLTQHRADSR